MIFYHGASSSPCVPSWECCAVTVVLLYGNLDTGDTRCDAVAFLRTCVCLNEE
jgi:hypothetical protein